MTDTIRIENIPDVVWSDVKGEHYLLAVVYVERTVRDWRWLWLRKKMLVKPMVAVDLAQRTIGTEIGSSVHPDSESKETQEGA